MSISILLVPMALSVASAIISAKATNGNKTADRVELSVKNEIKKEYRTVITEMNDELLLREVISELNYNVTIGLDNMNLSSDLIFYMNEDKSFNAAFDKTKESEISDALSKIREVYGKKVQEKVYNEVLEKYKEYGFVLENETVDENNSIVLTFNVGDK